MALHPLQPAGRSRALSVGAPTSAPDGLTRTDPRFSEPVGLWCPYCRRPFVGVVDNRTGEFAHGRCPVGRVDLERLSELASHDWYWQRLRSRIAG